MLPPLRDLIAGAVEDAARYRQHAKAARQLARTTRNPVERIMARARATEYAGEARKRDAYAKELRAQAGQKPRHRHDFSDGDVCNGCDMLRAAR